MSEISKLPWAMNPKNGRVLFDADGNKVLTCQAKGPTAWADADMVIRACNAFPKLVEAIKLARPLIKEFGEYDGHDNETEQALDLALTKIDNALASLAKGEPQ